MYIITYLVYINRIKLAQYYKSQYVLGFGGMYLDSESLSTFRRNVLSHLQGRVLEQAAGFSLFDTLLILLNEV
jgi:hypothetical protein